MFDAADDRRYHANNPNQEIGSNNQDTNTKIMSSSNKRRAAVASSFALFVTTLGLVAFIEIDNLDLPIYRVKILNNKLISRKSIILFNYSLIKVRKRMRIN